MGTFGAILTTQRRAIVANTWQTAVDPHVVRQRLPDLAFLLDKKSLFATIVSNLGQIFGCLHVEGPTPRITNNDRPRMGRRLLVALDGK